MRIPDTLRIRTVISNLDASRNRMNILQEQLATAKRVNRPSDDPMAATKSMRLRTVLESNIQYDKNIDDTVGFLTMTEAALNDVNEVYLTVKDLALKGANDTTSDRVDIANQLDLILDNLLEIANTKYKGKYIFGGTETLSVPFTLDTNVLNNDLDLEIVTYRGNSDHYNRQVNENTKIELNVPGSKLFDMTDEGGVNIFQAIYELRNQFKNNPEKLVRAEMDTIMDNLDKSLDQLLNAFLRVGTRKQAAYFNKDRFEIQNIALKERLSQNEDTDFGTAFIQFKAEENALNAALSAGARVISPSLLDFLQL